MSAQGKAPRLSCRIGHCLVSNPVYRSLLRKEVYGAAEVLWGSNGSPLSSGTLHIFAFEKM
jgi:hypothetical protein